MNKLATKETLIGQLVLFLMNPQKDTPGGHLSYPLHGLMAAGCTFSECIKNRTNCQI